MTRRPPLSPHTATPLPDARPCRPGAYAQPGGTGLSPRRGGQSAHVPGSRVRRRQVADRRRAVPPVRPARDGGPSVQAAEHVEQCRRDRRRRRDRDRKSTRLNPVTNAHLVCRLLLEKKKKNKAQNNNKHE